MDWPASRTKNKDIVDPKLEQTDPTPSIHDLFRQFNVRFFWGKLDMVEVSWSSKQMTSCAGVCSFSPRAGHCHIRLSAPLLSLRSRKDLVETLLHEMIHAFLFITKNYKDRSDHGPEFHKHMYRINDEAGTNISVYHTFNDEVRHFQNHVWRCNGPCQKRPPFFGFVRRANNRAPGPYDKWWSSHQLNCNGQFEKIKEPPGFKAKKKKTEKSEPNPASTNGIRGYFPPIKPPGSNISTLNDIRGRAGPSGFGTLRNAGSATVVVTAKPTTNTNSPKAAQSTPTVRNTPITSTHSSPVNEHVRNVWANKFPVSQPAAKPTNASSGSPANNSSIKPANASSMKPANISSVKPANVGSMKPANTSSVIVECDNCDTMMTENEMANHRKICRRPMSVPCPMCNKSIKVSNLDNHVMACVSDGMTDDFEMEVDKTSCPVCNKDINTNELDKHLNSCLDGGEDDTKSSCPICQKRMKTSLLEEHVNKCWNDATLDTYNSHGSQPNSQSSNTQPCPSCNAQIIASDLDEHLSLCLSESIAEDISECDEIQVVEKVESRPCPVCNKSINVGKLDEHLGDCLNESITEESFAVGDDSTDDWGEEGDSDRKKVICPVCSLSISAEKINAHIDECLSYASFQDDF